VSTDNRKGEMTMNKKILGVAFLITSLTITSAFALADNQTQEENQDYDQEYSQDMDMDMDDEFSIDDLLKELSEEGIELSKEDQDKLTDLYKKITALEEKEDFDGADKLWDQAFTIIDGYYDIEDFSLEDMIRDLKEEGIELSKEDQDKLTDLYKEITALEEKEDFDGADKLWDQAFTIIDGYYDFEDFSPEDMISDLKEEGIELSKEDQDKLTDLYKEITALEEKEDFDGADKLWDQAFTIIDGYYDFEDFSLEDMISDLKEEGIELSKKDQDKLTDLYKEITALEEKEDFDVADKLWEQVDQLMAQYLPEEAFSPEDLIQELKEEGYNLSPQDQADLVDKYKQIQALEEKEDYEAADKLWDDFWSSLEMQETE